MSEENTINKNNQNSQISQKETNNLENNDILNSDFFKSFETPKKLPEKKAKISNLIIFLKDNNTYFKSLKDSKKLLNLYDIIITNLIENNNNFVLVQIDLIEILSQQIINSENNELKNDFINFYKKSLPKLFDKFYLQNQKINQNLLNIFNNSIKRNLFQLEDYYPFIENICIEEDDEYKTNILNFLYNQINQNENISLDNIPVNIIETIKKSDKNEENENLNEISKKIMEVLDNRNKKKANLNINVNNDIESDLLNIPNTPMSQQDSKLAFSSFIKKISKAVKQENLNKKMNINNTNILENTDNDINPNIDSNITNKDKEDVVNAIIKKDSFENKDDLPENNEVNKMENNKLNEEEQNINDDEINNLKNNKKINNGTNNKNEIVEECNNEINKKENNVEDSNKIDYGIINENNENNNSDNNEIKYVVEKKDKNKINDEINYVVEKKEKNNNEINYVVEKKYNNDINYVVEKKDKNSKEINYVVEKKDKNNEEINYVVEKKDKDNEEINYVVEKKDKNNEEINHVAEKKDKDNEEINYVVEKKDKNNINNDLNNVNKNMQASGKTKTRIKRPKSKDLKTVLKKEENKNEISPSNNIIKKIDSNNDNLDNIENNSENIVPNNIEQIKEDEEPKVEINNQEILEKQDNEDKQDSKDIEIKKEDNIEPKEEKVKKEEKTNKVKDKKNKNEKDIKKDIANKKGGIKNRITRSRKLGVMVKSNINNKEVNKENKNKSKIEDNKNKENKDTKETKENKEEKPGKISVNINKSKIKEKGKKKETKIESKESKGLETKESKEKEEKEIKEEIKEVKEEKEIQDIDIKTHKENQEKENENENENVPQIKTQTKDQLKNQSDNNNTKPKQKEKIDFKSLKEKKSNKNNNNDFTVEILVKTPDNNKVQVYNEDSSNNLTEKNTNTNTSNNQLPENQEILKKLIENKKPKIEDFDEIPINTNSNNFNNNLYNEENINNNEVIAAQKRNSIEEFNKKIELALEQEKQDQLNKENTEVNINNSKNNDKDDPKFDEIKSLLGSEICENLSSPKWEMKKHAFELINNFVNENDENSYNKNVLFELIKIKLKNFKETNFNIIREAMNIFISMLKKRLLTKDNLLLLLNTYYEKMADIKLKDNIVELINTSIEESIIDLNSLISNLISKILKKNNVKILNEYSILFSKMVEDFYVKDLPIKEMINFCKYMAGNSNPQVRTSATNLICVIYKYVGEDVKVLIKDIKESTLKIIEAELEKVTVIEKKESKKKKNMKKKEKSENLEGIKKRHSVELELVGPVDISKKLTSQLLKDLSEGKWIEKKEACETIEKILNDANMKILPNGLNDLFNLIKNKLSDSNKNLVKILISLVNKFIQCLKKEFKPWTKIIALSLIPNLSDKNQSIKNECQLCFDKWVEHVGIETLVIYFPQFLKNENVEMRIEIMKFIKKYNDKFTKNIAENVYKELIDSLLICLQDRSNNVKNEAEDVIKLSLKYVNIDTYFKKADDFKPAIAKDLRQILDNILENRYLKEDYDFDYNPNNHDKNLNIYTMDMPPSNNLVNQLDSPTYKNLSIKEKIRNSLKVKKSGNINSNTNANLSNFSNNMEEKGNNYNNDYMSGDEDIDIVKKNSINIKEKNSGINASNTKKRKSTNKTAEKEKLKKAGSKVYESQENTTNNKGPLSSNSTVLRSNKKSNSSIEKKQKIQRRNTLTKNSKFKNNVFNSNNIKLPQNKSKRLELDKKFKFSIDTMIKDDINKLKETAKIVFCEDFINKIFSTDFKKEVEALKRVKNNLDERENINLYFDYLDILLKIIGLKLNNVLNPALVKNLFLFLDSLYIILNENDYKLSEIESNIIICLLIDKLSINNNQLKDHLINLINQYMELFDINKSGLTILNYALNKNNKTKSNVLDMIIELYLNKKINIKSKNYIKILSKYLLVNDNIVKSKCLTIFREIQEIIKEELWNIKDIGEKERTILENNLFNNEENDDEINDNNNNNNNKDEDEEDNQYNNQYDDYNEEENEEENMEDENKEDEYNENNYNSDEGENNNNNYDDEENNMNNNDNFNSDNDNKYNNNDDDENNEYNNEALSDNNNNDENDEDNYYLNNEDIKHKTSNNYYIKTDNKIEEKRKIDKYHQKNQTNFYKNNDIISKIQKLQNANNKLEHTSSNNLNLKKEKEDTKPQEKFVLPKKIVVKQKKNHNMKKIKNTTNANTNTNTNKPTSGKNMNFNSNNINNNYINNNIINNYYNNNNSMANNNNDLSISLYNDMNINNNQNNTLINNNLSNSTISSDKELLEIMNNLFSEDESEKMNTIIIIHEILCSKYQQNKFILIPNIDNIIKIIIQITHELFDCIDNLNNKIIPLKFAKYLVTILCKLTSNKELIIHISYKVLYDLCYELLNYLLINGLDKIGSNQEGNIIFKSLNSAMLRVIENCDTTSVILALLEIIKQNQNNINSNLLSNLAFKCLLKTTQNIESIINNIQLDKILLQMHLLIYNFDKLSTNNIEQNSQSDIVIIRFIKKFVEDIVKIKKKEIMEDYNKSIGNSQYKDKYIYSWIKNTLDSENNDMNVNNDNNDSNENNEIVKTASNNRSTSTNINKNRMNNSDKKREIGGFNFEGNKIGNNNLNKKSAIIVKKHANNSINNRYNNINHNTHSGLNNINVTKSSILGSSSISNNNKITIQKNNLKNSQIYKGNTKNKKFKK